MSVQNPIVMIIEDEELLLQAISKKLEINGIKSISCTGGIQAFDYLANFPELPDAIWLDYHLKDMDGLDVMGKLKTNPKWAKIPVVVVSNSASKDKVRSMLALGASKYFLKAEHRLDEIIVIIQEIINEQNLK